jgi:hypothetical protein
MLQWGIAKDLRLASVLSSMLYALFPLREAMGHFEFRPEIENANKDNILKIQSILSNKVRRQRPPIRARIWRGESYNFMDVGAADNAAIQLVKVQPYQLLVSDT